MWKSICIAAACLCPLSASVFDGRVLEDHNANPLSRVELRITRPGAEAIIAEVETDAQGRFRTPELPDAEYILRFSRPNYGTIQITTRPRSGMLLRLTRFGAIAGKLADAAGRPVTYAQVVALTASDTTAGVSDANAAPGEYRIFGLPPGTYQIAILTAGETRPKRGILLYPNNSAPRTFTISGGEDLTGADFTIPDGPGFKVSARAESAKTTSVTFTFIAPDHPTRQLAQQLVPVERPFVVEEVRPGNYELLVSTAGPAGSPVVFGRRAVAVVAADVDVSVPLDQTRSASFTLRTQDACPSSAIVEVKAVEAWLPNRPVSTMVQADKPAVLSGLAPSRYAITVKPARGDCYATSAPFVDLTRDSASQPVEVTLAPPGSIRGRLSGSTAAAVVLRARDGSSQRIAFPDAKGEFAFSDLPPGDYFAIGAGPNTHWVPDPAHLPPPFHVAGGAPTPVELHVAEVSR